MGGVSCSKKAIAQRLFGVAELNGKGKAIHLVENPTEPKGSLSSGWTNLSTQLIHKAIARVKPSTAFPVADVEMMRGYLKLADDCFHHSLWDLTLRNCSVAPPIPDSWGRLAGISSAIRLERRASTAMAGLSWGMM